MKDVVGFLRRKVDEYNNKNINIDSFGGITNYNRQEGNHILSKYILDEKPFSCIRMGIAETQLCYENLWKNKIPKAWRRDAHSWRTIFGSIEQTERYCELVYRSYGTADIIANFYNTRKESVLINKYATNNSIGMPWTALDPFFIEQPWTTSLTNKKVLIVSPFTKSIKKQYERIDKVHKKQIIPKFELLTVKSVWTEEIGTTYKTWFDALDFLKSSVNKIDFEVALLSCSAFGVPLCKYIKETGRKAIYVGGILQLYFGIMGNRWEDPRYGDYYKLANEHWIKPDISERPTIWKEIENGCYF